MTRLKYWILGIVTAILFSAGIAIAATWNLPPVIQRGDLMVATSTTQAVRLPVGATGNVLSVVNGVPKYVATSTLGIIGGGGSSATTTINSATGPSFTFATSSDTNLGLNITSGGATATFTPTWIGTLADGRIASAATWNAKQNALTNPVTGTGTATQVAFWDTASTINSDSNLYWDNTNKRLGVGGTPGTAKLYVNGNVGIGTTSPVSKLSVVGESAFAGGATVGLSYAGTAAPTDGLIIKGNVGIGTTSPESQLNTYNGLITLSGNQAGNPFSLAESADAYGTLGRTNASAGGLDIVGMSNNTSGVPMTIEGYMGSVSPTAGIPAIKFNAGKSNGGTWLTSLGNSDMAFQFQNNTAALVSILGSGNVGIGTTTPGANLSVVGTFQTSGNATVGGNVLTGEVGLNTGTSKIDFLNNQIAFTAGTTARFNASGFAIGGLPTNTLDVFGGAAIGAAYAGTTSPANGMIIQGNVGIGTTSPSRLLEVYSAANSSNGMRIRSNNAGSATYAVLDFGNDTNGQASQIYLNGSGVTGFGGASALNITNTLGAPIVLSTNNTEAMRITSAGNVGIGTTTPGNALTVIGGISSSNLTSGNCVQAGSGGVLTTTGAACGAGAGGITSLNGLSGATQTFATGTDTNIGLNIVSSGTAHTFTPTWSGTLADARIASSGNWNNLYNNVLSRLAFATTTGGSTFYVSTSTNSVTLNFPSNLLSTTTAASTYQPIGNYVTTLATGTSGSIFNGSISGNTLTLNLPFASGTNTGQLQAADWTTFNNKQATIAGGTNINITGGNTVNLNNSVSLTGTLGVTGVSTLASTTVNGTLTVNSIANCNSTQYLQITSGLFGCGTPAGASTASGTAGSIQFAGAGSTFNADQSNLWWDNTNKRLGLGTSSPTELLHIAKPAGNFTTIRYDSGATQGYFFSYSGDNSVDIGSNSNAQLNFRQNNATVGWFPTGGGFQLQNPTGALTILTNNAPAGNPQEATFTNMRPVTATSTEFTDYTDEDYSIDKLSTINIAKSGSGKLRPFGIRFWNQDAGVVATVGTWAVLFDPSGAMAVGPSYSTSTYDKTIILQVASSTAPTIFVVDKAVGTHLFSVNSNNTVGVNTTTQTETLNVGGNQATFGQYYSNPYYAATTTISTITKTIDLSNGNVQSYVLATSTTLTINNIKAAGRYLLILQQDATGSRTVTWPAGIHWSGGTTPTLTTTANKVDIVSFVCYNTSICFGGSNLNYSP